MNSILIIGAGQLGSRHLQGLAKYLGKLEIYVLDPSENSLEVAKAREKEISHNHKIFYTQNWEILPSFFHLVIVATNANIRESVINQLLEHHKVHFLILEKVLFQELGSYQRVHELLLKNNVITYVNHPRRMFESYLNLKQTLDPTNQAVFSVFGGNWGLGCNALHFLDLFVYLSGHNLKELDVSCIDGELMESSRKGHIEFSGVLSGTLVNGSFFSIGSLKGESSSTTVTIFNNEQRFVIQEGGFPKIYSMLKNKSFICENLNFNIEYQSDMTTSIVKGLLENNFCELPTFEEARHTHEIFITAMLDKYNTITGLNTKSLPIT